SASHYIGRAWQRLPSRACINGFWPGSVDWPIRIAVLEGIKPPPANIRQGSALTARKGSARRESRRPLAQAAFSAAKQKGSFPSLDQIHVPNRVTSWI